MDGNFGGSFLSPFLKVGTTLDTLRESWKNLTSKHLLKIKARVLAIYYKQSTLLELESLK